MGVSLDCPKCSSAQTQMISVIHAAGTSRSRGVIGGMGVSLDEGISVMPAGGLMGGTQQTNLAQRFAPPKRPNSFEWVAAVIAISFVLIVVPLCGLSGISEQLQRNYPAYRYPAINFWVPLAGMLVMLLLILAGPVAAYFLLKRWHEREHATAMKQYNESMDRWQRTAFCHRCGHTWLVP